MEKKAGRLCRNGPTISDSEVRVWLFASILKI